MSELPIFSHGCQWLLHSYLPQNTCFQGSSTWHYLHSTQKNAWPTFTNHMSQLVSTLETQPVMRHGLYLLSVSFSNSGRGQHVCLGGTLCWSATSPNEPGMIVLTLPHMHVTVCAFCQCLSDHIDTRWHTIPQIPPNTYTRPSLPKTFFPGRQLIPNSSSPHLQGTEGDGHLCRLRGWQGLTHNAAHKEFW